MASRAKKEAVPKQQAKPKAQPAAAGIEKRLKEKGGTKTFIPDDTQKVVISYVTKRSEDMIDYRQGLGIEKRWREADEEYIPHELDFGTTRKRFETDQDTGLRSRMVPVGDVTQQWRQASSAPTLLSKIQTAISIIVDQQPEADLTALLKKYSATTDLAYSLWKRNWTITDAKEKLKLVIFDLFKYGWAVQRTYPRIIKYDKRVLTETDTENPENDKYEEKSIIWFNDIDRARLDPYRTWIDEMAKPYEPYTTNEAYYEFDMSYDGFMTELGKYPNSEYVKKDSVYVREEAPKKSNRTEENKESKRRKDIVTVGIFESRHKDMYVIWIPKDKIIIHASPLPNDDGYLSITHTLYILRKSDMPYGVSFWEVIRQNKALYDKMKNMGMDQLVLSIMKFGFYSGTNTATGDGTIAVVPGEARQITSSNGDASKAVNWMEIPGPGDEFWRGLASVAQMMDDDSGITPLLEGQDTPGQQTLGEILHARESSLKRLKIPVENIAWLIEQDAYLSLSWMSQVYAIPTVQEFTDMKELTAFEQESQMEHIELFGTPETDEAGANTGNFTGPYEAHYLPQLSLHLEDRDGQLAQSKKSQFFQVGKDIMPSQLKWRGIFKVIPRSIIDSSQELIKATKMEVFNMIMPLLQFPAQLVARPIAQILKINEEDPDDWLPDEMLDFLDGVTPPTPQGGAPGTPLGQGGAPAQAPGAAAPEGAPPAPPTGPAAPGMGAGPTLQSQAGMTPAAPQKVVPGNVGPTMQQVAGGKSKGLFGRRT